MTDQKKRKKYEKYYRSHKIHTISKEIDKTVYEFLAAVPRDAWSRFAIAVGATVPSDKSVNEILARYRRRWKRKYVEKKPNED